MSDVSDRSDVPWRSRTVQAVLLSTALAPLGVPLISPTLPVFRDTFALTEAQASLLVSGYFLVGIVLSPFVGVLADRIGRKRVLVAGLGTFGLVGGAIAFAPSFEVVLALRVIQGTGAAAIFITTVTIIGDSFDGPQRTAVLGVNVAVLSATAALFPVLGGFLVTLGWSVPFLTYFAAIPVALFVSLSLEEPVQTSPGRGVGYLRDAVVAITTPSTLALFAITFLTEFLAFGVIFTALPFLLESVLTPVLVGVVLLTAETTAMVAASGSGRLARRLSSLQLIAIGFACYGAGFLIFALTTWIGAVVVAAVVAGAGVGLLLPSVDAALSDRTDPPYRAGAFSLRNSTTFLGRFAGPITFAGLAGTGGLGYVPLLIVSGVLAIGAAVLTGLVASQTPFLPNSPTLPRE
ncbi:Predicted arabinose efflux permease, MFS family [Halomicrobium zhouii]|uniref:Predicted arabinose efflux permease, MFS family n=1 Tax=Halomicrobium zhouii TaxID=767519 RepID=A0A1I6L388_9EURY|nr:MFS transporter [Halomicrobium zhouii]SFR97690.1 Predicted arabinose efflux permease, MFS family [Halomicrobium zhouii]